MRRAVVFVPVFALVSCASISQKYESEVRFERCYGLDWKKDVDPGIRSRCWEDWLTNYSKGQSRDRIEYAKKQATGGAVSAPTADASGSAAVAQALPEPTSVFSPVPMMASPNGSGSASASPSASAAQPRSVCESKCDRSLEGCLSGCGSSVCEQFCSQKHTKCAAKCAPPK
ncbi:MAG: hypothetical protein HOW73_21615 [Polyangiaceae bacterium]|nr:hypothetical protein [Polyangiaceae bacterium]